MLSDLELIEGLTKNTRNYVHDGYILDVIPLTLIPLTFFGSYEIFFQIHE